MFTTSAQTTRKFHRTLHASRRFATTLANTIENTAVETAASASPNTPVSILAKANRKPLRSKKYQPEPTDPSMPLADLICHDAWLVGMWWQPPTAFCHMPANNSLPLVYRLGLLSHQPDVAQVQQLLCHGGFAETRQPLLRRLQHQPGCLMQLLQLDPQSYEESNQLVEYRYQVDAEGEVSDMISVARSISQSFQLAKGTGWSLATHETARSPSTVDDETDFQMFSGEKARQKHAYLQQAQGQRQRLRPALKVYTYCVGPNDLFNALWELDVVDLVVYVDAVAEADVVIHRRPKQREKQFYYEQYRREAKQKGIPFVSVNEPTTSELRRSLLPVFRLYAGQLSKKAVETAVVHGKIVRSNRIRL